MIRPLRRFLLVSAAAGLVAAASAGPALACAGLVTPGGNVKLVRASTLAAWADGNEHYVTSFTFEGGGAEFGSIVPLPGVPSKVERGGDWTLQRLEREVAPPAPTAAKSPEADQAAGAPAEEVYNTRIDALDITILRGGGASVGQWAREHGFQLTPDAPEVLDFYANRSPIFMAARFNADAAKERNQEQGEGTPVHLTIPMDNPWVPLRILGLGKATEDLINANVFLLTPSRPNLLPEPQNRSSNPGARPAADEVGGDGVFLERSEQASKSLLDDLRSDKGMEWVPAEMWLTYLRIGEQTDQLHYDLAIDKAGVDKPSRVLAGLDAPPPAPTTTTSAAPPTTAATPTTAKAKPKPKPTTTRPAPTPTTAAPAPPVTTPEVDGSLPVVVESPEAAAAAQDSAALAPASPASSHDESGMSPAFLIAAAGGGALAAGLAAWALQTRRRTHA